MAYTEVEVFIPAGTEQDVERERFLDDAVSLAERGFPITVYVRGEDEWAFEECEHVADMIAASGDVVLPITLLGPQIVTSWQYPTAEQMERFAKAAEPKRKDPRFTAAASACGPGGGALSQLRGGEAGTPSPAPEPAGFAAVLAGKQEKPRGGPEIGGRRNLMGGDFGSGLPAAGESATSDPEAEDAAGADSGSGSDSSAGGCCGGACGCGGH